MKKNSFRIRKFSDEQIPALQRTLDDNNKYKVEAVNHTSSGTKRFFGFQEIEDGKWSGTQANSIAISYATKYNNIFNIQLTANVSCCHTLGIVSYTQSSMVVNFTTTASEGVAFFWMVKGGLD